MNSKVQEFSQSRQLPNEVFKPIKDFEGIYEISQAGNVKSVLRTIPHRTSKRLTIRERILKPNTGTNGYRYVHLRKPGTSFTLYIHRWVAITFIPNPINLPQVNHKDGNKTNNHVDNLEWCDQSTNMLHAYKEGLQKDRSGENNPNYRHGRKIISRSKASKPDIQE